MAAPSPLLARLAKARIAREVRGLFDDGSPRSAPVERSADSLFGPGSVVWRVHGDVTTMMVGGISALLLQMLHPGVLAGVWDHSNFREDMIGRLRRTARFIAITTCAGRGEAERAIARVRGIHDRVRGDLPGGGDYAANDPALLAWVHATESISFLRAWLRYGEPGMSIADRDRYFAESAEVAEALGADPVPRSYGEAVAFLERMRPALAADARTREVARLVLAPKARSLTAMPFQAITQQAAVDLLPRWARAMHGLSGSTVMRPLVNAGAMGLASTLRWAFH